MEVEVNGWGVVINVEGDELQVRIGGFRPWIRRENHPFKVGDKVYCVAVDGGWILPD